MNDHKLRILTQFALEGKKIIVFSKDKDLILTYMEALESKGIPVLAITENMNEELVQNHVSKFNSIADHKILIAPFYRVVDYISKRLRKDVEIIDLY